MRTRILTAIAACAIATTATANEFETAMQAYIDDHVKVWASDPRLIAAVKAQNNRTGVYDDSKISELDSIWQAQTHLTCGPALLEVLANEAAQFLRDQAAKTDGAITEIFVMDARGMNVAATGPTSDYWQGDEDKFTQTYLVGPDAVHFSEVGLDNSTQQVQGQVSMTVVDDLTGKPIGALTVGINLTALM